jgi:hypothetical protein
MDVSLWVRFTVGVNHFWAGIDPFRAGVNQTTE